MIIDRNTKDTRKFIWQGLYLDALRGWDSTGLATVNDKGLININKKALAAQDFLGLKVVDDQIENHLNRVFIGHNRAATRGAINNVNSHPFRHDHITMVHNGSLNHFRTFPEHERFQVDSDAFTYAIANLGYKEAVKRAEGAFALVWYDENDKMVRMVRNSQRPLHYAIIKNENMLMYASEENMLRFLIARAGYKVESVHEVPTHTVITFDPNSKNIGDCEEETVEFYKYIQTYNKNRSNNSHQGGSFPHYDERSKELTAKKTEGEEGTTKAGEARAANVEAMFKEVGLEKGEEVQACMYSFRPYANGTGEMGVWEGSTCHEPFVSVMSYGTTKDTYEDGEVYGLKVTSMQISVTDNHPKPIREKRAIVDYLSMRIISEDEFLDTMEKKDKEAADKQRKAAYNKREDDKFELENKNTIILASEIDSWPTVEQQVQAMAMKIPLLDSNSVRKTKTQLVREIRFGLDTESVIVIPDKKEIIHLPAKIDVTMNKVLAARKARDERLAKEEVNQYEEDREDKEEDKTQFIYLQGPRGPIKLAEFNKLTESGCSHCGGNIFTKDADHLDWWGEQGKEPICPACVKEWFDANSDHKVH